MQQLHSKLTIFICKQLKRPVAFSAVHKLPLVPIIKPGSEEGVDGRTAFGVLLLLENHHDKDKELFRVVLAIHDTINEGGKGGEESFGQMFRKFVVVGMVGDEVFVVCLPGFVIVGRDEMSRSQ